MGYVGPHNDSNAGPTLAYQASHRSGYLAKPFLDSVAFRGWRSHLDIMRSGNNKSNRVFEPASLYCSAACTARVARTRTMAPLVKDGRN